MTRATLPGGVNPSVQRVGIAPQPLPVVLDPGRERDWPSRKIEQIAVEMEITQWQLKLAGAMEGDIHSTYCRLGVAPQDAQKRIKRCGRIRIQQRVAQARLAHHAPAEGFLVIARVTKTRFPIPILEVIAKLAHLTAKSDVE